MIADCLKLITFCEHISLCENINDILVMAIKTCYEILYVEKVIVGILENKDEVVLKYEYSDKGLIMLDLKRQLATDIIGISVKHGLLCEIKNGNIYVNDEIKDKLQGECNCDVSSLLCNPLKVQDNVFGVIQVINKRNKQNFSPEEKIIFKSISSFTSINLYRLMAQERSSVETNRLQGVFEALTDGIMVIDKNGNPIIHNKAIEKLFMTNQSQNFALKTYLNFLIRSIKNQNVHNSEVVLFKPHGLVLSNRMVVIRDRNGELSEVVVSVRNISEQRELDRKYTQFYSIMLNKLNKIINKSSNEKDIRVQKKLSLQQKKIMRNLLFLTELKSGPLRIEKENFDIISIFMKVIEKFNKKFYKKNIHLDISSLQKHGAIAGRFDRTRMIECLSLILENASKILRDGKLIINAECNSNNFNFEFVFIKPGISSLLKMKSLDWQSQIELINSGESKNLNLEFSFVKHIINAHKGAILMNLENPNRAILTITIPVEF